MKLHKLKVDSTQKVETLPRLWIELSWMLGDGDGSKTNRVSYGFRNENEFIKLYLLWESLESVDLNTNLQEVFENHPLLQHLEFDSDDFVNHYVPSDPVYGINYKLVNVAMKGHQQGQIETYKLI